MSIIKRKKSFFRPDNQKTFINQPVVKLIMWYICKRPCTSGVSARNPPSLPADCLTLSAPDNGHPYKIPGVDNQYNRQWTSAASPAAILIYHDQQSNGINKVFHGTFK
jgi:hypothetical protein